MWYFQLKKFLYLLKLTRPINGGGGGDGETAFPSPFRHNLIELFFERERYFQLSSKLRDQRTKSEI